MYLCQWWELANDKIKNIDTPLLHVEEAETSLALAIGERVLMDKAVEEAFDRRATLKERGFFASEFVKYDARHKGPYINPPMDMIHDISTSGVVGDASKATIEEGRDILNSTVERLVMFCKQLKRK